MAPRRGLAPRPLFAPDKKTPKSGEKESSVPPGCAAPSTSRSPRRQQRRRQRGPRTGGHRGEQPGHGLAEPRPIPGAARSAPLRSGPSCRSCLAGAADGERDGGRGRRRRRRRRRDASGRGRERKWGSGVGGGEVTK